jgi:simple sugar transport system ATP-binding protein
MQKEIIPLVEMRGITKHFPGTLANDSINFQLHKGEVHALLGENGAGKTTLMNILSGLYRPDSGQIFVGGETMAFNSTRDAIRAGIGMVHQQFSLVDNLTVAENVILGIKLPGGRLNMKEIEKKLSQLGEEYSLKVNPTAFIWQLSAGEQQKVEILKLIFRDIKVLIMDEPTSVLTPQEALSLSMTIRRFASIGKGILYITHKLNEVMDAADRVTILRAGRNVATVNKTDIDEKKLSKLMVGKEISISYYPDRLQSTSEILLQINNLNVVGDRQIRVIKDFSITVHSGQLVGLAGIAGNGQKELAEAIAGLRPIESGHLIIGGEDLTGKSSREIIDAGLSLIPEDRLETGLIPRLKLMDNSILKCYRTSTFSRKGFIKWREATKYLSNLIDKFAIKVSGQNDEVWKLSGGNKQRLLLAREISSNPKIIIAAHPTSGLDIQAQTDIENLLMNQRNQGAAILLISEDLDEIMAIADRIVVIFEGRIMGEADANELTKEEIGLMMMGRSIKEINHAVKI